MAEIDKEKQGQIFYTVQEAAAKLQISEYAVRSRIKKGELKAKETGVQAAKGQKLKEGETRKRYMIASEDLMRLQQELFIKTCTKSGMIIPEDFADAADKFYTLREMMYKEKVNATNIEELKNKTIKNFTEMLETLRHQRDALMKSDEFKKVDGDLTKDKFLEAKFLMCESQITMISGYIREIEWHYEMYKIESAAKDLSEQKGGGK